MVTDLESWVLGNETNATDQMPRMLVLWAQSIYSLTNHTQGGNHTQIIISSSLLRDKSSLTLWDDLNLPWNLSNVSKEQIREPKG